MQPVDVYREQVLDGIRALASLDLPLASAHGCVLAVDVRARWPLPNFDNSAMDGFAVRSVDTAPAASSHPVELTVVDDVPAGFRSVETLATGQAIRIMTGAPMPDGADAVVPVEATESAGDLVRILAPARAGAHVRRAAEDVVAGEIVLTAGTVVGARQTAMLAAVGYGQVHVHPRPRVAVISTGSELVEPGTELRHGLISDSNAYMLAAACWEAGADAYRIGPVADDAQAVSAAIEDQLHRCDLIVTSGGVSMGEYDTVKAVLSELGTVTFTKVAMNPGMPQGHGTVGEQQVPIITLPGNPVSSYVSFEVFVRPVIAAMRGLHTIDRPRVRTTCRSGLSSPAGKRQYARARFLPDGAVSPVGHGQGSHVLGGLTAADALIEIDEDTVEIPAGGQVVVWDLRHPGSFA